MRTMLRSTPAGHVEVMANPNGGSRVTMTGFREVADESGARDY
jgi:hypothetical protein